jgi:hypothetical protein
MMQRIAWALLCAFVFTIPWEKSVYVPGVGTFARLLGILAFVAGFAANWRRWRAPNLALAPAAVFVLWSGLTWFWSLDPHATLMRTKTLVELLAMFWLIWATCRRPEQQRQLMTAYVAGAFAGSCIAFARYAQHMQTYYRRYAAAGFDPNDFGMVLALSIPMSLYLALRARGWASWCYRGAALAAIVAILLTGSRTALIATYISFIFAAWTWRAANWPQRLSTVALAAVLLSAVIHFAPAPQRHRLATISSEITRGTLHDRTRIWKSGLKAFKSHLVLGVGAGAYPEAVRPWMGRPAMAGFQYVAHNTFLSVLVETGPVGFAIAGLLAATLAVFVWMMPAAERALWTVMALVWAAGVSTLTWEHYKPTWLIMALIATEWARAYRRAAKPA